MSTRQNDDPARPPDPQLPNRGNASSVAQEDVTAPKLPHERDESTDDMQPGAPRQHIQQAHDDVVAGREDTSRGEATDEAYRKLKK
jgi:hypothetical protein